MKKQKLPLIFHRRGEGDSQIYSFTTDHDDPGPGLEVCRLPAGLVSTSGMQKEFEKVLEKMVVASIDDFIKEVQAFDAAHPNVTPIR